MKILTLLLLSAATCFGGENWFLDITNAVPPFRAIEIGSTPRFSIWNQSTNVIEINLTNGAVTIAKELKADEASKLFWTELAKAFDLVRGTIAETEYNGVKKSEIVEALDNLMKTCFPDFTRTDAVYLSPAESLRREANRIEARDAAIKRVKDLLAKIKGETNNVISLPQR